MKHSAWGIRAVCLKKSIPSACHDRPSTACSHDPLWKTFETIEARKTCRLFQKSIPATRHGRPSTARPHGPLWQTSETNGTRNLCRLFQKFIPATRHGRPSRPALTNFWNKRRPYGRPQVTVVTTLLIFSSKTCTSSEVSYMKENVTFW